MGNTKSRGNVTCPICKLTLTNEIQLIEHYNREHNIDGRPISGVREFRSGDRVVALWEGNTWQYFTATIKRKVTETRYEIDWDDGDTTGRFVDVTNLYQNTTPSPTDIKRGSCVLFKQGSYSGGNTQLTGGIRWHEGIITDVRSGSSGYTFNGHHSKGESEGKSTSYSGYSYEFRGLTVNEIRLSSLISSPRSQSANIERTDGGTLTVCNAPRKTIDLSKVFQLVVGHRVIAEWKSTGRYFSATVTDILSNSKYLLDWDDNDATGRSVFYYCVNIDSIPRKENLEKDAVVFFNKGNQWHAGTITRIYADASGQTFYDGEPLSDRFIQTLKGFTIDQLCSKIDINQDGTFNMAHVGMATASPGWHSNNSPLKEGDRVLAMWEKTRWQYFPATIVKVLPNLHYQIEWDDGDTTGLIVDCFKIAKDVIPDESEIGVGSTVFFQQGRYKASASQLYAGIRWHEGIITNRRVNYLGEVVFDGCHTKGTADNKWITYQGYSHSFEGIKLEDLRVSPNMFDLINHSTPTVPFLSTMTTSLPPAYDSVSETNQPPPYAGSQALQDTASAPDIAPPAYTPPSIDGGDEVMRVLKEIDPLVQTMENSLKDVSNVQMNDADVFISYCWTNSSMAKEKGCVSSFEEPSLVDPRRIAEDIARDENKVWLDTKCLSSANSLLEQHAKAIKTCHVFIPCISDQYSASTFCRMQFQYASGLPDKKIIPLVVGTGSEWKSSVIGLSMEREKDRYQVIDFQRVADEKDYNKLVDQVLLAIKQ